MCTFVGSAFGNTSDFQLIVEFENAKNILLTVNTFRKTIFISKQNYLRRNI